MASARANRDYIITNMVESLSAIAELADGKDPSTIPFLLTVEEGSCRLFQHFTEFEVNWFEEVHMILSPLFNATSIIIFSNVKCIFVVILQSIIHFRDC